LTFSRIFDIIIGHNEKIITESDDTLWSIKPFKRDEL